MDIGFPSEESGRYWGDIFFHPRFLKPARESLKLKGEVSIISAGGAPTFAVNLLTRTAGPFRTATLPLLFQYFGALALRDDLGKIETRELNSSIARKCDYAIFSFPPGFPVDILELDGWRLRKFVTPVFFEKDMNEWGRGFRDDVKNKIRKAKRNSVEISQTDSFPIELWERTYVRKNMNPPIEPIALAEWCASLVNDSLLKIFTANIDGIPVAFRGELVSGDFAYDWIAGSNPDFHATGANQLLMSDIGRGLADSGVKTWDLVGGQIQSIYDFKKSFGAKDVVYYQGEKSFNLKGKLFSYLRKIKYGL